MLYCNILTGYYSIILYVIVMYSVVLYCEIHTVYCSIGLYSIVKYFCNIQYCFFVL